MSLKNTQESYGLMAKIFHWPMALIMMGLIIVGLYMTAMEPSPDKYELYGLHKSFGLLILWMVGLRILWRFYSKPPSSHENHQKWERTLAKLTHFMLYVSMIGMPLTGWLMSSAGGYPVSFFGLSMPPLMAENKDFGALMNDTHRILSYVLIGAVLLHAVGALKHHFIDKDTTFQRMAAEPMVRIGPYLAVLLVLLFTAAVVKLLFF